MKEVLKFVVIVAVLAGLYVGYRVVLGKQTGGPCSTINDCAELFNVQCLSDDTGSYCSQPCRTDAECPPSWHCAAAHSPDGRTVTEAVCSRSQHAVRMPGSSESTRR
jgi:hypothetical protein